MSAPATSPAPDPRAVLSIRGLTKRFGRHTAVNEVSFDVFEGDIFGFLGANGAGKSTTLYMTAGLVRPTSGTITIFGHPHTDIERVRTQMGALIEVPAFYEYLSGRRNLEVLARMQAGIPRSRADEVLEMVGLAERANDRVVEYSHGMKQRLGIAQALLNRPKLVLLDEPTSGLDPEGSALVWDLLRRLAREERLTVLISSHLLHEVEEGCNRIAVINQGVIVACDQVRSLLFFSKEDYLLVFDTAAARAQAETHLRTHEGVEVMAAYEALPSAGIPEDCLLSVRLAQGLGSTLMGYLVARDLTPRAMIPQRKTLKQFFLELTRRQPPRAPLS
jgi:ABC-2 type transport system ATP-binding protein